MKQILLLVSIIFISFSVFAQKGDETCPSCLNGNAATQQDSKKVELSVFPNPMIDFFGINNDEVVGGVVIFNTVGRKIKSFEGQKSEHYNVADLPAGIYLVQILNKSNKIVQTQRIRKV